MKCIHLCFHSGSRDTHRVEFGQRSGTVVKADKELDGTDRLTPGIGHIHTVVSVRSGHIGADCPVRDRKGVTEIINPAQTCLFATPAQKRTARRIMHAGLRLRKRSELGVIRQRVALSVDAVVFVGLSGC